MQIWARIVDVIEQQGRCALLTVVDIRGSTPREPGARILIGPDGGFHGTIGGGELEWQAIATARAALQVESAGASLEQFTLGPDLGQCCGGTLRLLTEVFDMSRLNEPRALAVHEKNGAFTTTGRIGRDAVQRTVLDVVADKEANEETAIVFDGESTLIEHFGAVPRTVLLFGAGHVGRALMLALAPLPFAVRWIDQRANAFPGAVAANVSALHKATPASALDDAPNGAFVVVMTHSHALDLAIIHAALADGRLD
jgi:xanthine dehydrogenase accessory factor